MTAHSASPDPLRAALEQIASAEPYPPKNALVLGEHYEAFAERLQNIARAALQASPAQMRDLLREFHALTVMEGSDGHEWVRRDQVSAVIQGLPVPPDPPDLVGLVAHALGGRVR